MPSVSDLGRSTRAEDLKSDFLALLKHIEEIHEEESRKLFVAV